jgi:hypothetical protein
MSSPNPDHSKRDYSFPIPYKFDPKPGETPKATNGKELRWRKVLEDIWKGIYRHALTAGLTTTEAKKIAEKALLTALRNWHKQPQQMTIGKIKGRMMHFAQQQIAEMVRRKRSPKPYDVSVAWRQKHDTA